MFAHWKLADTRAVGMVWVKITDIIGSMKADFIPKKHLFGLSFPLPIGSMYAIYIYGNMYHQYIITPNVSMYIYICIPYMDPMGLIYPFKRVNLCEFPVRIKCEFTRGFCGLVFRPAARWASVSCLVLRLSWGWGWDWRSFVKVSNHFWPFDPPNTSIYTRKWWVKTM